MKALKRIICNFEYKRIEKELENLEGFFDNRSEAIACLGEEYVEDRNYEKYNRRYDKLYKQLKDKVKKMNHEVENIIKQYPYFISVGMGNDWNKNVSLDKTLISRALKEFDWNWYLEESFINDDVYSLIIEFDFFESYPLYIKELNINGTDIYDKIVIYINKEKFNELLRVLQRSLF